MADYPVSDAVVTGEAPVSGALLAYLLFGIGAVAALVSSGFPVAAPLMGLIGVIGLIVAYVKRDEARGTWVASHLRWLIRTFWFSLLWAVVGGVFAVTIIGLVVAIPLWAIASIWVIYRVIRGYLLFKDSKPIPGM
jgi:uncharacterized membrane protein